MKVPTIHQLNINGICWIVNLMVVVSIGHLGYLIHWLYCVVYKFLSLHEITNRERTQHNEHHHTHKENHAVKLDKKSIELTLKFIICVFIGVEVSLSPNPYTTHLIIALVIYICLKHDLPNKVEKIFLSWFDWRNKWVIKWQGTINIIG